MTVALLSIGTELVRGEIVNANATWLADQLTQLGLNVEINEPPFTPLNRVISQDPAAGTLIPVGSTVTITII